MRSAGTVAAVAALAIGASAQDNLGVCDHGPQKSLPFCNPDLNIDERVEDLVSHIRDQDVPGLLADNSSGVHIPNVLDLPPYAWWNEGLHGVASSPGVIFEKPTVAATSFPQIINLASSFNRTLFHRIGQVIATEARAFHSAGHAGLTFWTPDINIFRDPRWGRGQETPGEDPFLTTEYAVQFVTGLQGNLSFLQVSACCKHFSAYSQEFHRHELSADVGPQDFADTYFPVFEACIKRANVSSVMCSYNAVNGIPSCADKHLLTDIVRSKWGFDGYIVSDCGAVYDIQFNHNYTNTTADTCAKTLEAGTDLNCGSFFQQYLGDALPKVDREAVRRALRMIFRTLMRLGYFEPHDRQPFSHITIADLDTPEHRALALQAAQQSVVLLKNDAKTLPLDPDAFDATHRLVLLGPHVHSTIAQLGNYAGTPSFIVSPAEGVSKFVPAANTDAAEGCAILGDDLDEKAIELAAATATSQVVLFVGINQTIEAEDVDRTHIRLPGRQSELIRKVAAAAAKPIVVVVLSGGPVDLLEFKQDPKVGSIVYAGYLGQSAGTAIAQVLFGEVNPSGRLTHTFYPASFADQITMEDMHMRPHDKSPGRTHRFYTGEPVFPFGHGLSYTTFRYGLHAAATRLDGGVQVTVAVANVGELIGDNVLLCFASPPRAKGRPLQTLVAFDRVDGIVPGHVYLWKLSLPIESFALPNEDGKIEVVEGKWTLHIDGVTFQVDISNHGNTTVPNPFLANA
ncbi:hypothetical protein AC1031_004663 [Aphanomyces cochlioides]|nr:hypothetical protein AC1031_004663 [Aphanomyces cochlioides]